MEDNHLVTHGLHWLTLSEVGWKCAHPDCEWQNPYRDRQDFAQQVFDRDHAKLSEAPTSVHT